MTIFRCLAVWFMITLLGHGQALQKHRRVDLSNQVELPVRGLYQDLVSRPIGGIPTLERMKSLSPYLSDSLLKRITQARACNDDYFRLHPKNDVKPPLEWLEFGLFSGPDDRSGPHTFEIENSESQEDGSIRVNVRLTEGIPPEKPWTWEVAVIVIRENGHLVIDDVVFLKDKDVDTESRLSEILKRGCDGSHWVGYGNNAKGSAWGKGFSLNSAIFLVQSSPHAAAKWVFIARRTLPCHPTTRGSARCFSSGQGRPTLPLGGA